MPYVAYMTEYVIFIQDCDKWSNLFEHGTPKHKPEWLDFSSWTTQRNIHDWELYLWIR